METMQEPKYLTIQEVADRLRVKPPTVRSMIRDGQLRAYRLSPKVTRIRESDLDAFLRGSASSIDANQED